MSELAKRLEMRVMTLEVRGGPIDTDTAALLREAKAEVERLGEERDAEKDRADSWEDLFHKNCGSQAPPAPPAPVKPEAKCARTACVATRNVVCRHTQTGELYCPRCARKINEANPGLVEWPAPPAPLADSERERLGRAAFETWCGHTKESRGGLYPRWESLSRETQEDWQTVAEAVVAAAGARAPAAIVYQSWDTGRGIKTVTHGFEREEDAFAFAREAPRHERRDTARVPVVDVWHPAAPGESEAAIDDPGPAGGPFR